MKVTVNEQSQKFYLAFDEWKSAIGHEIKIDEHRFCAIPTHNGINISEVTSGVNIFTIPITPAVMAITTTKEETTKFYREFAEKLAGLIESTDAFDEQLAKMKKKAIDRLGEMPPIENVDTSWIEEGMSDIVH